MPSFSKTLALSFIALGATVIAATASCSNYGEGDRCDVNNGLSGSDSDCQDNLVCTPASSLGTESDICCPADRSQATVAPCIVSTSPVSSSSAPPDAGADSASSVDSGVDSGADTGSDSGADSGSADASNE